MVPSHASPKAQANYEWRRKDGGNFAMNAHVTVTDIDKHLAKESGEGGETGGEAKPGGETKTGE